MLEGFWFKEQIAFKINTRASVLMSIGGIELLVLNIQHFNVFAYPYLKNDVLKNEI